MEYLNAFICGGVLCAVGQILIDKTKLTPARILTGYVVAGVALSAVGLYEPLVEWGGAGATVPLTGFGHNLAKGVEKAETSCSLRIMSAMLSIVLLCQRVRRVLLIGEMTLDIGHQPRKITSSKMAIMLPIMPI